MYTYVQSAYTVKTSVTEERRCFDVITFIFILRIRYIYSISKKETARTTLETIWSASRHKSVIVL